MSASRERETYVPEPAAHAPYCSRATWRRWVEQGYAPKPVRIGPRMVRWLRSELDSFEKRLLSDRGQS